MRIARTYFACLMFILNVQAAVHAEGKMTRTEVCEFLVETEDDPESERITPDKIEEGKKIIPSLIDYMQNGEDSFCASLAMDVLGRAGDKCALEPLLAELYKKQGSQRISPIAALGNLGDSRALEPLITELQRERTPHDQISMVVAKALGGLRDSRAVETLIKLLQTDKDPAARYEAATALGTIKDKRSVQPLITALQSDPDENVKGYAAGALGEIEDARTTEALIIALGQENKSSSQFILITQALAKKHDTRARNALIEKYRTLKDSSARAYLSSTMKQAGISIDGK